MPVLPALRSNVRVDDIEGDHRAWLPDPLQAGASKGSSQPLGQLTEINKKVYIGSGKVPKKVPPRFG